MGNSMMKKSLKEQRWEEVERLLRGRHYNKKDIDKFITSCEAVHTFYVSDDIVAHFSSKQQNRFITAAVKKGQWQAAGRMLKFCEDIDKCVWVIAKATSAGDRDIVNNLLSHCSDDQLGSFLKHLATRGMWQSVGKVLERGVSETLYRWAVEEALESSSYNDFQFNILPYCSPADKQLRQAVLNAQWKSVREVLATGVRCALDRWAVEEASKGAVELEFERYILPHYNDDQPQSVLKHLAARGMWQSVGKVLERGVSGTRHRWAVEEASKRADDIDFMNYILLHCSDDQLAPVLKHLITRGMWRSVGKVLERGVSEAHHRWAVEEAIKRADDGDFGFYILHHCRVDQLEYVLKHLVTRGMWQSVGKVLERGVSETLFRWAVEEALESSSYRDFQLNILPHCSSDDKQLRQVVLNAQWKSVGEILTTGVRCVLERWALDEASKGAVQLDFERYILPHYNDDQPQSVLKHLADRGMWQSVGKVLGRGVSDTRHRWAVEEASKRADDIDFMNYILLHCSDDQLAPVLTHMITRGMWRSIGKMLERGVSDTQHRWVVEEAIKRADDWDFGFYMLPHCSVDQLEFVLKRLVTRGKWQFVGMGLERGVSGTLHKWAVEEASKRADDMDLRRYIFPHCSDDHMESVLKHLATRGMWQSVGRVLGKGVNNTHHRLAIQNALESSSYNDFKSYILPHCSDDKLSSAIPYIVKRGRLEFFQMITQRGETMHLLLLSEMCRICTYTTVMKQIEMLGQLSINILISCLSKSPLLTEATNVALRFALCQNKWDLISKVRLSHMWEQVRRELFRAAVEQRRWSLVKQWADHTVYDNQRWWAQEEAYKEKQWDLMLLLTDYGMTDIELMRVRYRLAKYAYWGVVVNMIKRGVDVTEMREVVERAMKSKKTARDEAKRRALIARWRKLRHLEDSYTTASSGRVRKWSFVLFYLHRHPRRHPSLQQLLQSAIRDEAWHVVRHLLSLGLDTAQRGALLTNMISRRQWGVCRVLLEQGVSVQSCLEALPVLMDSDQWTLVARVVEFNVGDDWRQRVMRRAMERREGSVVWRCISTMQHYRLSVEERDQLFQQAMSNGLWEAVRPLIEEEDSTGLRHRDTALLEAIEQHQWDVVDRCQWLKADINMKDRHGETPLNRAGRKKDWTEVKELVIRGGDPNVLDMYKYSILNMVIQAGNWYLTMLIIEHHGNIHEVDDSGLTPLQFLKDYRQEKMINHLMLRSDQSKVVNWKGETTLHAIALDKKPELLYSQIVRGGDPLTLTKGGQSVLLYAVQNPHCAQTMVAECIKLGFGTHQPQFNVQMTVRQLYDNVREMILNWRYKGQMTSPLLLAVVHGRHVVAHMLYESGSCSYAQLLQLYTQLRDISKYGRGVLEDISKQPVEKQERCRARYKSLMKKITTFLPYLREMATTPRSLVSTCRLVISHCLDVRGKRERDVQQLPLPDRMKNYVLFADLADPDYA